MTDTATIDTKVTIDLTPNECDLITRALRHLAHGLDAVIPEAGDLYSVDTDEPLADTVRRLGFRVHEAGFPDDDDQDGHMRAILLQHPGITSVEQYIWAAANQAIDYRTEDLRYAVLYAVREYGANRLLAQFQPSSRQRVAADLREVLGSHPRIEAYRASREAGEAAELAAALDQIEAAAQAGRGETAAHPVREESMAESSARILAELKRAKGQA